MSSESDLVKEFIQEAHTIIQECLDLLDELEQTPDQFKSLDIYGNKMDRIMGTAENIRFLYPEKTSLVLIHDYTKICKTVAYNATAIQNNPAFVITVIGFLLDATELLLHLIEKCESPIEELKSQLKTTFIDRLKWISSKFSESYKGSVGLGRDGMSQDSINDLLKKMGVS